MKGIVPEGSYLAADDFDSPKDLANEILRLNSSFPAYARRFDWVKKQKVNDDELMGMVKFEMSKSSWFCEA